MIASMEFCGQPMESCRRRRGLIKTQREAVPVLQMFGRCIIARKVAVILAKEVFRRIYDDEFNTYFYYNLPTGQSTWTKPSVNSLLMLVEHSL
jgi:hypothetical protein